MATLNTQQKALLLVNDFVGQPVIVGGSDVAIEPVGVVTPRALGNDFWIEAAAVGECDVTVTKAGSVGTLHVTVTAAPLTVTLGTPEPK